MKPYCDIDGVTLYHGDCLEIRDWLAADVLVTDPPYGRAWRQGHLAAHAQLKSNAHAGIAGDHDTTVRDAALTLWGDRLAIVFGDLLATQPARSRQCLIYCKPPNAGIRGATAGYRRDVEAIYLCGPWPSGLGGRSSLLSTSARSSGNPAGLAARYGHPHAKPLDVIETLLLNAKLSGVITDPFAGSGSVLIAARNIGLTAIGVELEEAYCEIIARRLQQTVLDLEFPSSQSEL